MVTGATSAYGFPLLSFLNPQLMVKLLQKPELLVLFANQGLQFFDLALPSN